MALGARDLESNTVEVARRDTLTKETVSCDQIELYIKKLLDEIQANIYKKALDFRTASTREVDSYDDFKIEIEKGGFLLCHWDGTPETEERIKNETKATIRCIPLTGDKTPVSAFLQVNHRLVGWFLQEPIKIRNIGYKRLAYSSAIRVSQPFFSFS